MSVECPTCGDTDFDEQKAMRIHHKLAHGESISGFDKTCAYCGDEFEAMMSETKYCSEHCFGKANAAGESNPAWKGGKVTLSCEYCEGKYDVTPAKEDTSRFCSPECLARWRSENHVGEDHPNYKGGESSRGGVFYQKRRETLARDNYQCRSCGLSREEHYDEYNQDLEAHHIRPIREFGNPEDAHTLDNLVTACIPCHSRYEGLPVFPA